MKKFIKELYPYVVIVILVALFRTFIATPVKVEGSSMSDYLENNDILILNKLDKNYNRFDVVVVKTKINGTNTKIVKRIIGLPGDSIKYVDNVLYINDKEVEDVTTSRTGNFNLEDLYNISYIPDGYYFVMGDNRGNSLDSRDYRIGLVSNEQISGTVIFRLFPFNKIGIIGNKK